MNNQNPTPEQPRIPGVRYRKVQRERYVDVEFRGQVKRRKEKYHEWVPVPPVNLDRLYLRAVIAIAVSLTLIAVVWSTTAIGRLLSGMVPGHEGAGYIAALAFEVPWVACLMVQWILRDQPERAKAALIAGWVGLGVVVTAVVIDGFELNMPKVGAVAACVSVLAKGLWWIVLRLVHVPLDEEHAGWLEASRQDLAVTRVMLGEQSRLTATEAWMAQVYGTDSSAIAVTGRAPLSELPAVSGHVPDMPAPVSAQVIPPAAPAAPPAAPVPAPVPPVVPAVPAVPAPVNAPVDSGSSVPSVPPVEPEQPAAPQPPVPPVTQINRSPIAEICRAEIKGDPKVSDADLVDAVKKAGHPDRPNLADTVRRTALRIDPKRKAS
ncbi:hypothetical protein [Streptomyces sp. A5-4]|uniref:hypothetical protein n=1 Tax=Streptomyces sp. A5-4 TaxID=3384771 RepID=UPI003DA8CDA3